MADVFGYEKAAKVGGLASPSNVGVFIGNTGALALAQSVRLQYGRQVRAVTTLGSDSVWMQPGPASGTLDVTRIVGEEGAFAGYQDVGPCETTTISIAGTGTSNCGGKFGTVTCTGCMFTTVGLNISVQDMMIMDNATWTVGGVHV